MEKPIRAWRKAVNGEVLSVKLYRDDCATLELENAADDVAYGSYAVTFLYTPRHSGIHTASFDKYESDLFAVLRKRLQRYHKDTIYTYYMDDKDVIGECYKLGLLNHISGYIVKPLYMYDHSGQTISLSPFGCRWDSGCIGFAIACREAFEEQGCKWRRANTYLEGHVEYVDCLLQGDAYMVDYGIEDGESDTCSGFIGRDTYEDVIQSVKDYIGAPYNTIMIPENELES